MRRNVTDFDSQDIEALNAVGTGGGAGYAHDHLTLQGKGGVGKAWSPASSPNTPPSRRGNPLHRYRSGEPDVLAIRELGAEHLELMHDGKIDSRGFDVLMERLLTDDGIFIVDNGASTFIPLWSYIVENNVLELLRATGRRLAFTRW